MNTRFLGFLLIASLLFVTCRDDDSSDNCNTLDITTETLESCSGAAPDLAAIEATILATLTDPSLAASTVNWYFDTGMTVPYTSGNPVNHSDSDAAGTCTPGTVTLYGEIICLNGESINAGRVDITVSPFAEVTLPATNDDCLITVVAANCPNLTIGTAFNPTGGANIANWNSDTKTYTGQSGDAAGTIDVEVMDNGGPCNSTVTINIPACEIETPPWGDLDNHIFVLNEGNFGSSNGSLTAISRETDMVWDNIFELVNDFKLGDVVQSMTIHNDKAYIVVNNSGKIEVADAISLESVGTISGLSAPRYFLPINDDKAYITNITFSGSTTLDVIDLQTNEVIKTIPTAWGEQMVMSGGKVFVGIMNTYDLMVIDAATDEVIQTLSVNYAPNSLQVDKNGKVWILSDGGFYGEDLPALRRIDPNTLETEQVLTFANSDAAPQRLAINGTGDQLYYLENGKVWSMNITDNTLPDTPVIASDNSFFYGLGIDPTNNYIYTTDAADFQSKGSVLYYQSDGTLIDSFEAGVIPGGFSFN